jgi:autotransporter-associated beta strand protein
MKKLLKTYLWVSISSCLFSGATSAQPERSVNDAASLLGSQVGEFGIAEHAAKAAALVSGEPSTHGLRPQLLPDQADINWRNLGLFEMSVLAFSAGQNSVSFDQIIQSKAEAASRGRIPAPSLSLLPMSTNALGPTAIGGESTLQLASVPANLKDFTKNTTANTLRIQKLVGAFAGTQVLQNQSTNLEDLQLSSLASDTIPRRNTFVSTIQASATITAATVISGNGTTASPYVLSGSGDITSYIEANQDIQLSGGNYTITIPAATAQRVNVNGNIVAATDSAFPAIQTGTPLLIYSGVISGQGQVVIQNTTNDSVQPSNHGQINGGALSIQQAQTFTNPALTGGVGSLPQAVFVIDPNTFLGLERNGLDGGPLTTLGTIPYGQTIVNNGYLYVGEDAVGQGTTARGQQILPLLPNGGEILSVTGTGNTSLGLNYGEGGLTQQFIGGKDANGNPIVLGPAVYAPGSGTLLTLDQVHIQDHTIVNEDVLSDGDTNVVDAYGLNNSVGVLEPQYSGSALSVTTPATIFPQSTIINGNVYADAANLLVNGNSIHVFNGQALHVPLTAAVAGLNRLYQTVFPADQAEKMDFVTTGIYFGRLFDITGGTMLMGSGQAIVDHGDGTNNTFAQGNPYDGNFYIGTGDFGSPVTNAAQLPYLETVALDYSGTYTFNVAVNLTATGQGLFGTGYTSGGQPYGNFVLVTPPSGVNHVVVTQPVFLQGITDVQPHTILQLGDGTTGTNPNTTQTLTIDGQVIESNSSSPNLSVQTSGGNGLVLTATNSTGAFIDPAIYEIYDNGLIVVDNTPNAQNILDADQSAAHNIQRFLKLNQLDTISGTGGLEQSGALALTLAGNTVYSGPTTIDPGRTLYLKSSSAGPSDLPNSTVHIGDGAVFDLSQGDATQYVGDLDSTVTVTAADLNGSVITNTDGTQVAGASSPTGITTITTTNATSGTTYIGQSNLHIGTAFSTGPDAIYNGAIVPGGDGVTQALGQVNATATTGGSLIKEGNFKQTLNGVNLYTGSTTVNGGTLALGPAGSIARSAGVFLQPETVLVDTTTTQVNNDDYFGTNLTAAQIPTATEAPNNVNDTTTINTVTTVNLGSNVPAVAAPSITIVIDNPSVQFNTETEATTTIVSTVQTASTSSPALEIAGNQTIQDFGGTVGSSLVLDSGSQLNFGALNNTQFDGVVQGSGNLNYQGKGTIFRLTGDNPDFTGITTIASGTLQLVDGGSIAHSSNVVDNGTFDVSTTANGASIVSLAGDGTVNLGAQLLSVTGAIGTFSGVISGTGGLTLVSGKESLAGSNTYSGGTTITGGTLQLGSGGTSGSVLGDIADYGTLAFNRSDINVFTNLISGSGSVTQAGNGTTVLTADHTYTGGTTIAAGTLQIGDGGSEGSVIGDITNNAALVFDRADDVTFNGVIGGSGSLNQLGSGNLILTGANTFTGITTIGAGTLQLGNGGTSGTVAGNIVDNTELMFDRSDAVTYVGAISGVGAVSQIGTGTLVLDGNSSVTGGTSVTSGTLLVGDSTHSSASLAGDVSVASGATLSGHGFIGGNVAVANGAHLAPGDSIATLFIGGDLNVAQGGLLDYEFGKPNAVPTTPGANDQTNVGGNLSLNGAVLNVVADAGFGVGLYRLFNYGGTLTETNGGILFGAKPANDNLSIQTLTSSKQINLLDLPTGILNFWNGNGLASPTQLGGGDGGWSLTAFNWSDATGTVTGPMQPVPGLAIFAGAAGTVTVDNGAGAVSATAMQFATNGYVMNGDALTLVADTSGNAPSIRVGDGTAAGANDVATLTNILAGSAGLVKTDYGTLVLTAANTYTGGTTINAGTLQLGNGGTTGGILGDVVDNGTLVFDRSDTLSYGNLVSGTGGLTQLGSNTLTLTGSNTYTGITTISEGTLALASTGSIANSSSIVDNSALDISNTVNGASIISLAGKGAVNLGSNALSLTQAADTFGGVIAGAGSLNLVNGNEILTGSNVYSGGTRITGGTLQLGNGGIGGSVTSDITDNGTISFDRSDTTTIALAISGSGGILQSGAGTTLLNGPDSYTGNTEVANGNLQVDTTLNSDALVDAGGTLSGTGQVADLTVNGNLLIGDGIAEAKIFNATHNVAFNPGSQFQVYVDPSGAHSLLQVGGSTILKGGNVSVSAASGNYGANQSYEILESAGGVSGTFGGLLVTDIDLAPTLQYQSNGVFLVLNTAASNGGSGGSGGSGGTSGPQPIALFSCAQLTANQCATEHALQTISLQPPASLVPTLNALVSQTLPQARVSLDGLNGQIFADANMAAARQMGSLRALIDNRASQPGDGTIWFQAHSDDAALGNPSQTLSATVNNQGSYAGTQSLIADGLQMGAFVGDTRTNLNLTNGDHARLSTPQFGLYMTGVFGPNDAWYGNGSFAYGRPQVRTTRYVRVVDAVGNTSSASYSQNLAALSLEFGYHGLFGVTHIDPFIAYDGAHVKHGLIDEGSDQPSDLSVQGRSLISSLLSAGVHLSRDISTDAGTLTPELTLAVARQQGDQEGTANTAFLAAPSANFTTSGAQTEPLLETVSGGVSAQLAHGWRASVDATYTHATHENDRGVQAKLSLSF